MRRSLLLMLNMTTLAGTACAQVPPALDQSAKKVTSSAAIQAPHGTATRLDLTKDLDAPCTGTASDRKSALCAQWVSADAAEAGARWALYSLLVGTFTFGAAVVAALFAYRSANAAKGQLQHERSLVLPRFEVGLRSDVYSGSHNVLYLRLERIGDNPAGNLGLDEVILHQGALGPQGRLEQSSSTMSHDEGQRLTAGFRLPGDFGQFASADKVAALFEKPTAFTIRWHYTDVAGNLRRTDTMLTGCIARMLGSSPTQQTATIDLAGTTFHERA